MAATYILSPIGGAGFQFFDNNGNVLSGGKLYTYAGGTTTPQATYTDSTGGTPQSNPMTLDSAGRVPGGSVWLTYGVQYKFVLKDSVGNTVGTWDNFPGPPGAAGFTAAFTRVQRNTAVAQVVNANSTAIMQYDQILDDTSSSYSTGSFQWTAPATGTYLIKVLGTFYNSGGAIGNSDFITLSVYKNNAFVDIIARHYYPSTAQQYQALFLQGDLPLRLNAADTIDIRIAVNSGVAWSVNGSGANKLTIVRIS